MTEPVDERAELKELIFTAIGRASMCWNPPPGDQVFDTTEAQKVGDELLEAIAALSQPAGEPVAWRREWNGDLSDFDTFVYAESKDDLDSDGPWQPLYTHVGTSPSEAGELTDERTGWMIERRGNSPSWWVEGFPDPDKESNWTTDPNKAAIFPTIVSGHCVYEQIPQAMRKKVKDRTFFSEHKWIAASRAKRNESAQDAEVRKDWVLVPRKSTEEMSLAGWEALRQTEVCHPEDVWKAMIAAMSTGSDHE